MKCHYHPDLDSTSGCTVCSRNLCPSCAHSVKGRTYCQDCLVAGADLAALTRRPEVSNFSPSRAALVALVPGLGAVYNRQYPKAVVHFAVLVSLFTFAEYGPGAFVLAFISFYIFTIVDAYRSAEGIMRNRILHPEQVDREEDQEMKMPVWGGLLVLLGVIFFLNNLGAISLRQATEYGWPLLFVAAGLYLIFNYMVGSNEKPAPRRPLAPPPVTVDPETAGPPASMPPSSASDARE